GEVGPDLSAIGGKFDRQHLIESILEPSAQIVEGYHTTTLTTADDRSLSGIVKAETERSVTLVDVDGKRHEIPKDEIETRRAGQVSLRPAGPRTALSPAECTHLPAYLESLQTGGPLTLPAGFTAATVATGITGATALELAPDGRVLVCEQTGTLRVVKNDKLLPAPFVTLPVDSFW